MVAVNLGCVQLRLALILPRTRAGYSGCPERPFGPGIDLGSPRVSPCPLSLLWLTRRAESTQLGVFYRSACLCIATHSHGGKCAWERERKTACSPPSPAAVVVAPRWDSALSGWAGLSFRSAAASASQQPASSPPRNLDVGN